MIFTIITVAFTVAYQAITLWMCRGEKLNVKALCLGSRACALTLAPSMICIPLPTGSVLRLILSLAALKKSAKGCLAK